MALVKEIKEDLNKSSTKQYTTMELMKKKRMAKIFNPMSLSPITTWVKHGPKKIKTEIRTKYNRWSLVGK